MNENTQPSPVDLQVPTTLQEVIKTWSRQVGANREGTTPVETREKKYNDALMSLLSLFANHHDEIKDGDFVRAYRFFRDSGLTKRLSNEAPISIRYSKLERIENTPEFNDDGNSSFSSK